MKHLFVLIAAMLLLASVVLYASYPDLRSDVPVIYWVTDRNPARAQQVAAFHQWLVEEGHVTETGVPKVQLRLDTGNSDLSKKIIQGVSGVASDVMDLHSMHLPYFAQIGILEDLTEVARQKGFSTTQTYPAILPEITVDGRQYAFPCNVTTSLLWVNKATFRKHGQEVPPQRWTLEEFERRGKAFVAAANEPGQRQTVFFAPNMPLPVILRSKGLGFFNETLTRVTFDDPRFAQAMERKRKWIDEDRILPSAQEQDAFDTAGGYGGAVLQLFNRGNYGMFWMGRYALIQLRRFGELELTVVEPPHGGFPNSEIFARAGVVYVDGGHPELAHLFMTFLASEAYNALIVHDADALPPNPAYTQTEAFRRPPDYPNEWGVHEKFAEATDAIAIAGEHSPFVLTSYVNRQVTQAEQSVMTGRMTPEQAGSWLAQTINGHMQRNLRENTELQARYEHARERQQRIDALRAAGEPVPAELIKNPFHRKYYAAQGWLGVHESSGLPKEDAPRRHGGHGAEQQVRSP